MSSKCGRSRPRSVPEPVRSVGERVPVGGGRDLPPAGDLHPGHEPDLRGDQPFAGGKAEAGERIDAPTDTHPQAGHEKAPVRNWALVYWLEGKRVRQLIWDEPPPDLCQVVILSEIVKEGKRVVRVRGLALPKGGEPRLYFADVEVPFRAHVRTVELA